MWSALEPVPQIEELPDGDEKPVGAQRRSEWLMIGGALDGERDAVVVDRCGVARGTPHCPDDTERGDLP
jgi:hypothetical protein